MKGFKMPERRNYSGEKIEVILEKDVDKIDEDVKIEAEKEKGEPVPIRARPISKEENYSKKATETTMKTGEQTETTRPQQAPKVSLQAPRKNKISPRTPQAQTQQPQEEVQEEEKEFPLFLTPRRKPKPVRMTTYIDENVHNILQKLKEQDISITAVVNAALKDYLRKYNLYIEK